MVIASPWTRGGVVCSQVFDHTSVIQFLERFLTHKTGKAVVEPNISPWRRTVCGDLTSAFQARKLDGVETPAFPTRNVFIEAIHKVQFKQPPSDFKQLTVAEVDQIIASPLASDLLPQQEKGVRRSCALPYELNAEAALNKDGSQLLLRLEARKDVFGSRSAGSAFNVYVFNKAGEFTVRSYAVAAGSSVTDSWLVRDLEDSAYHLQVLGPNGFFREFQGDGIANDPAIDITMDYARPKGKPNALTGGVEFKLANNQAGTSYKIEIHDNAYHTAPQSHMVLSGSKTSIVFDTHSSYGWYDFSVTSNAYPKFLRRYAGRVETGKWSFTDPFMGRVIG
jgi:phospholipase C